MARSFHQQVRDENLRHQNALDEDFRHESAHHERIFLAGSLALGFYAGRMRWRRWHQRYHDERPQQLRKALTR